MKIGILSMAMLLMLAPIKLVKKSVSPDITVFVPESFTKLTEEEVIRRYGVHRIPVAVFTGEDEFVNFSVNKRVDTVSFNPPVDYENVTDRQIQADLKLERAFLKTSLYNTFTDIRFLQDTSFISENGKEKYIRYEFEGKLEGVDKKSQAVKTTMYNYIQYIVKKDETFIFNFGCPARYQANWQETAHEMMNSVKVN